jgi:hypothetical protein
MRDRFSGAIVFPPTLQRHRLSHYKDTPVAPGVDLRLASAKRACAGRIHAAQDRSDRSRHGRLACVAGERAARVSGGTPSGRCPHWQRPKKLRRQPLRPKLGHPQPVYRRRHVANGAKLTRGESASQFLLRPWCWRRRSHFLSDFLEGPAGHREDCVFAAAGLPPLHGDIDIMRVDLQRPSPTRCALGCDQHRALYFAACPTGQFSCTVFAGASRARGRSAG